MPCRCGEFRDRLRRFSSTCVSWHSACCWGSRLPCFPGGFKSPRSRFFGEYPLEIQTGGKITSLSVESIGGYVPLATESFPSNILISCYTPFCPSLIPRSFHFFPSTVDVFSQCMSIFHTKLGVFRFEHVEIVTEDGDLP